MAHRAQRPELPLTIRECSFCSPSTLLRAELGELLRCTCWWCCIMRLLLHATHPPCTRHRSLDKRSTVLHSLLRRAQVFIRLASSL